MGDTDVPVKIVLHLDNSPEKFKLSSGTRHLFFYSNNVVELASLLDIHTDTKANIIMALWQYVKLNKLQDQDDKRTINCDDALSKIFGSSKIQFPQVPDLLNLHLLPPDPVVLDYVIRYVLSCSLLVTYLKVSRRTLRLAGTRTTSKSKWQTRCDTKWATLSVEIPHWTRRLLQLMKRCISSSSLIHV